MLWIRLSRDGRSFSFDALGPGTTSGVSRLSSELAGSVSANDVVTADPDLLMMSPAPVSRLPDVIRAAVPISGTSIIRSISDGNYH